MGKNTIQSIRAVYITTVPVIGGAELNLLRLLPHLQQLNVIPVTILIPPGGGLSERFRENGFSVSQFCLYQYNTRAPWRYLQSLWQLTAPIVKSKADLVHINHHYGLEYTVRASRLAQKPYIVHVRGIESLNWVIDHRELLASASRIVADSNAVKLRLVEGGLAAHRIEPIHNSVDLENYATQQSGYELRKKWGVPSDCRLIGIAGQIIPLKGIADFLYAAAAITRDFNRIRFAVIGDGPVDYVKEMKSLAQNLGLADIVVFTGFQKDMSTVLPALDILIMATYDPITGQGEACPNIVLEAMASRTLVVARRVGGVVELLNEDCGILVNPYGVAPLANGILQALQLSPDKRNALTDNAYTRVSTDFTVQRKAKYMRALYADILSKHL